MAKKPRLVSKEWLLKMMFRAYLEARKNKIGTSDEFKFELNWRVNIEMLVDDILAMRYKPSRGIAFIVTKPVRREIFAAPFRDRIVHHFLYDMVAEWWDERFIYTSFSCRKGKGTLFGAQRLLHDVLSVSENYKKKAYVIKLDIQGYFMSLPRKSLYERAVWGLKRQYPNGGATYNLLKYLWGEIIFDDPVDGVRKRPPFSGWLKLPNNKSLFKQLPGYGIVIGNLSSQLLSNIYLDQLDRFVTMQLGYKYYGRYVDDFYIVVPAEKFEQAKRDIVVIENFLRSIGLTLHPKKRYMQEVSHGVEFLGTVVRGGKLVPGKRFKNNFYQKMRSCAAGQDDIEVVQSMLGHCQHISAERLCKKAFEAVGWEY